MTETVHIITGVLTFFLIVGYFTTMIFIRRFVRRNLVQPLRSKTDYTKLLEELNTDDRPNPGPQ